MRYLKVALSGVLAAAIAITAYWYIWSSGEPLGYHVRAGDVYRYKMTMDGTGTVSGATPQPIPIQISGSSIYRIRVLKVNDDGTFTAQWRLESGSMSTWAMGMLQPNTPVKPGLSVTFRAEPTGRMVGKPIGGDLTQAGLFAQAQSGSSVSSLLGVGLDYPRRHIRVGGSWRSSLVTTTQTGGPAASNPKTTINETNRLVSVDETGARRIGKFRTRYTGTTPDSSGATAGLSIKGTQRVRCALDSGMPESGDTTMEMSAEPKVGNASQHLEMRLQGQLTRLPLPKAGAKGAATSAKRRSAHR